LRLLTHRHPPLSLVEAIALHLLAHGHTILPVHALGAHRLRLLHAILANLLPTLGLLHAILPNLLSILGLLHAIRANLLMIMRLLPVHPRLLTRGYPLLRLDMGRTNLMARGDTRLRTLHALLPHLDVLSALWPLHRDTLRTLLHVRHRHALLMLLDPGRRLVLRAGSGKSAAAVASATAAAAVHEGRVASASAASAAVVAMRPSDCRCCDRQRSNARGEKHLGHDNVSFRTVKTDRSRHRSNT
jgi:hypothetical protein